MTRTRAPGQVAVAQRDGRRGQGAQLNLTDPANRAAALALLTPSPVAQGAAIAEPLARIDAGARLTADFFDVTRTEVDGEIKVGAWIGGGAGGGQTSNDRTATGAYVRERGGTFQERQCKR